MKHWVFDLDGTIVDSIAHYERAIERIFGHFNLAFSPEVLLESQRHFLPQAFFLKYLDNDKTEQAMQLLVRMNQDEVTDIATYAGIPEFLDALSQKVKISIWTGRDLTTAKMLLEYHNLEKFIERCVSRDCVQRTKPHPDGLEKILSEAKHKGDDVIMVGDHEYDIIGARSAGVKAISVDWHGGDPYKLEGKSDMHFSKVADLSQWALSHY